MEAPSVDMKRRENIHIFSEFEDEERQGLSSNLEVIV